MKVSQDKLEFQPVAVLLETAEEVQVFKMMCYYARSAANVSPPVILLAAQLKGELDAKTV